MTDSTLLLLLTGPLQSWGDRSATSRVRDTGMYPTRSGVVGLLAACLGLDRYVDPIWAEPLTMSVRIDRPGHIENDFHTAGGGYTGKQRMRTGSGGYRDDAVVSDRRYLADAAFVVALTGPEELITRLAQATTRPRYTPFLGRKACPPGTPLLIGTTTKANLDALAHVPLYGGEFGPQHSPRHTNTGPTEVEVSFASIRDDLNQAPGPENDEPPTAATRTVITEKPDYPVGTLNDAPLSYNHWHRTYATRAIGEETVTVPHTDKYGHAALAAMRQSLRETP